MLRNFRSRRRSQHGAFLAAVVLALIILFFLFHTQSSKNNHHHHPRFLRNTRPFHHEVNYDSLLSDSVVDDIFSSGGEDIIDALDVVDDQPPPEDAFDDDDDGGADPQLDPVRVSGFFFYHVGGVIRRAFTKRSLEEWDRGSDQVGIVFRSALEGSDEDLTGKAAFGSDDAPVDESVRSKVLAVKGVEDALLLKVGRKDSPLREGWGDWFDKKSDFLKKEKMLRSSLDVLNPSHNPILQDPDGVGITGLTKGDKILHKAMLNEFKRVPFRGRKTQETNSQGISRHE